MSSNLTHAAVSAVPSDGSFWSPGDGYAASGDHCGAPDDHHAASDDGSIVSEDSHTAPDA